MKIKYILLVLIILSLFGCATPQIITLKDGSQIYTSDDVEFDQDSGFYSFTDKSGKKKSFNKDEVLSIEEL